MRKYAPNETNSRIAENVGVTVAAVGRWHTSKPKPEHVITFADIYGADRLEAMVAAGYLEQSDIQGIPTLKRTATLLHQATNKQLLDELTTRLVPDQTQQPPRLAAADTSTDDGVTEWQEAQTRGEEPQTP